MLCFGLVSGAGAPCGDHPGELSQGYRPERTCLCRGVSAIPSARPPLLPLPDHLQGQPLFSSMTRLLAHHPVPPSSLITSPGPAQTPGSRLLENRFPEAPLPTPTAHPASRLQSHQGLTKLLVLNRPAGSGEPGEYTQPMKTLTGVCNMQRGDRIRVHMGPRSFIQSPRAPM